MLKLDVDKAFTGTITTVSGNVGYGKNTFSLAEVRCMARRCFHDFRLEQLCPYCKKYDFKQEDRYLKLYANFPVWLNKDPSLWFLKCEMLDTIQDYIHLPQEKNHSVVILDEPNAFGFDSHGSAHDKVADEAGYKMQHTRKYNRDIIFLTQLWSMVNLRGKRLTSNTIFAVEPTNKEFQYGWYKLDSIIPISIRKSYAREKIFPYFDSGHIMGEREEMETETDPNVIEA